MKLCSGRLIIRKEPRDLEVSLFPVLRVIHVGVINLAGRVFMHALDCPFRRAEKEIERLKKKTGIIIVDMHAEATSEKQALGWFLDGRVSAVLGTHTHVQTADERILPRVPLILPIWA